MTNDRDKAVKIMVSMSPAVYGQLEKLSKTLGGSKSRIVQQAIISMADVFKEVSNAVDKDVSIEVSKG